MSVTIVEQHNHNHKINSKVSIKPFIRENSDNMGLQNYDMSVFEGVFHEEPLACLEINGIKRYVTGLNEFAPEIKVLNDEAREAKIKYIRETVAELERELAGNVITDLKSDDFWNKVQLLKPNNSEFWDKIVLRVGNDPVYLKPKVDPYDRIKLEAIIAGGFSMIAPSLEDARKTKGKKQKKFYLDKFEETIHLKTEIKKLRNKALAELDKLFSKNQNKLFYVCKMVDSNPTQYKKNTPNDVMYDNMDTFINGNSYEKNKKKCAMIFNEVCSMNMEELKIRSLIKDANFYRIIATKSDGHIYHMSSGAMMGKTPSDVFEYLKNPLNEEILVDLTAKVEAYWKM